MIDGVSPSSLVVNNLGLDFKQDMKTKASYGKNCCCSRGTTLLVGNNESKRNLCLMLI